MAEDFNTWNLDDLFNGLTESEILERVFSFKKSILDKKDSLKEDNVSAELVLEIIKLSESLEFEFSKLVAYYSLRSSVDVEDEKASAKLDYYSQLAAELDNDTMFFDLWFIGLSDDKVKSYIQSPVLSEYKQVLKNLIKAKPHTRSEEVEQILNLKNVTGKGAFAKIYEVFTSSFRFELFDKKDLTQEEITSKYSDASPEVREAAYNSVLSVFKDNSTTLSELYKNVVLSWVNENMKIRNHSNFISPRNLANNLNDDVVKIMISVIRENVHIFQEYFKLKKDFLSKKGASHSFSRFHIYAPYEKGLKDYSFEDSKDICLSTYKDFDEDFYLFAKKIFDENHIHSHPRKGKRSGAFCYGPNNEVTPYILLNHTNKTRDLFTVMHELGHGIHDLFTFQKPFLVHHPSLPLAETASIFGELILSRKLLKTDDEDERASLLLHSLDNYYASIIRQTYFVVFEELAHKKISEGATKKELDDVYFNLLKEQFGNMEIPDFFKHEWNYIPHIHHTPFYCYAYSWGNLLVLALYAEYEKNPGFKEKIKDILKAGASDDTLKILKDAGINPESKEFWERGFDIIKKELEEFRRIANAP